MTFLYFLGSCLIGHLIIATSYVVWDKLFNLFLVFLSENSNDKPFSQGSSKNQIIPFKALAIGLALHKHMVTFIFSPS